MTKNNYKMLFLIFLSLLSYSNAMNFFFEMEGEVTHKCFLHFLSEKTNAIGTLFLDIPEGNTTIGFSLKIADSNANILFNSEYPSQDQASSPLRFAFVSTSSSEHSFCISKQSLENNYLSYLFSFELRTGVDAFDYNKMLRLKNIKPTEMKISLILDYIKKMKKEREQMWVKDAQKFELEEYLSYSILWTSGLTIFGLLIIAYAQFFVMKKILKRKKII